MLLNVAGWRQSFKLPENGPRSYKSVACISLPLQTSSTLAAPTDPITSSPRRFECRSSRRWSQRFGARASCPPEERASVFETLDLGEWSTDKAARRRQGLALSVGLSAWTLLAATPCRLTRITVEWASAIEKAVAHARRVRASGICSGRTLFEITFVCFFMGLGQCGFPRENISAVANFSCPNL